jgi:hypothetical protein
LTFSEAKKTKMQKVTVEGADLAKERYWDYYSW